MAKSVVHENGNKLNVREIIQEKKKTKSINNYTEKLIPKVLFGIAAISVFTTIGIVLTLLTETIAFFKDVPFIDFFTGTQLKPLGGNAVFGVLPLLTGTVISSAIAMMVAIPIGLMTAIFLSEYASERLRKALKPLLEILAGIPTIVYGFFAFTFVTPLLRSFVPDIGRAHV